MATRYTPLPHAPKFHVGDYVDVRDSRRQAGSGLIRTLGLVTAVSWNEDAGEVECRVLWPTVNAARKDGSGLRVGVGRYEWYAESQLKWRSFEAPLRVYDIVKVTDRDALPAGVAHTVDTDADWAVTLVSGSGADTKVTLQNSHCVVVPESAVQRVRPSLLSFDEGQEVFSRGGIMYRVGEPPYDYAHADRLVRCIARVGPFDKIVLLNPQYLRRVPDEELLRDLKSASYSRATFDEDELRDIARIEVAATPEPGRPYPPGPFIVRVTGFADGKKISVIKAVRALTDLGLKESKDLVESIAPHNPAIVLEGVDLASASKAVTELKNHHAFVDAVTIGSDGEPVVNVIPAEGTIVYDGEVIAVPTTTHAPVDPPDPFDPDDPPSMKPPIGITLFTPVRLTSRGYDVLIEEPTINLRRDREYGIPYEKTKRGMAVAWQCVTGRSYTTEYTEEQWTDENFEKAFISPVRLSRPSRYNIGDRVIFETRPHRYGTVLNTDVANAFEPDALVQWDDDDTRSWYGATQLQLIEPARPFIQVGDVVEYVSVDRYYAFVPPVGATRQLHLTTGRVLAVDPGEDIPRYRVEWNCTDPLTEDERENLDNRWFLSDHVVLRPVKWSDVAELESFVATAQAHATKMQAEAAAARAEPRATVKEIPPTKAMAQHLDPGERLFQVLSPNGTLVTTVRQKFVEHWGWDLPDEVTDVLVMDVPRLQLEALVEEDFAELEKIMLEKEMKPGALAAIRTLINEASSMIGARDSDTDDDEDTTS